MSTKPSVFGLSAGEIERTVCGWGERSFRARQIIQWIYKRLVFSPVEMSNLPKELREKLAETYSFRLPEVCNKERAEDGTVKFRLSVGEGESVECVLLPESEDDGAGVSLCLSTQVGCALGCAFCGTGLAGFTRDLEPGEIVSQALVMLAALENEPSHVNILLMGMGEPLLNQESVIKALAIFNDPQGLAAPMRRMVVSTAGIPGGMRALLEDRRLPRPPQLALSLNAPNQELRARLMPAARKYPLDTVLPVLAEWPVGRERVTVEYVLLAGVNDEESHAAELANLLKQLRDRIKINLIPHNRCAGIPHSPPDEPAIQRFLGRLVDAGFRCTVRRSRGAGISAACGQLAAK